MSDEKRTEGADVWHLLTRREPGEDPAWDALGDEWVAVDGVIAGGRLYAKWTDTEGGQSHLSGLCFADVPITADLLRSVPVGRLENMKAGKAAMPVEQFLRELQPLRRRSGEDPERFSERVAAYYRQFAVFTSKPAKMIADHSRVPAPTVHGWIREARLRGKLPPGKRGKAG
ncbi:hypothetical protein [Streptomyces sp. UG1]|uniref:hypothetical protein n=1 Tax=Streptomyces sp. UG1 TaxID=3417652 RepID=UPI003CF77A3A